MFIEWSNLLKNVGNFTPKKFYVIAPRYFFIFKLKNPAAFHDDFWSCFFNIWIVGFSAITEIILYRLPGRYTIYFYVCTGKYISSHEAAKRWLHVSFLSLSAIVIHTLLSLKILWYKKNNRIDPKITENLNSYEKSTIFDLSTSFCIVMVASLTLVLSWKVNDVHPKELNYFPNYLFEYFFRLVGPVAFNVVLAVLHYCRNPKILPALLTELKSNFNGIES